MYKLEKCADPNHEDQDPLMKQTTRTLVGSEQQPPSNRTKWLSRKQPLTTLQSELHTFDTNTERDKHTHTHTHMNTYNLQTNRRAAQRQVRMSIPRQLVIKQDKACSTPVGAFLQGQARSVDLNLRQKKDGAALWQNQPEVTTTSALVHPSPFLANTHTHTHPKYGQITK